MGRQSGWAPSIVPKGDDQNVYLVVDDLGRLGRVYRETDVEATDLEVVIKKFVNGARVVDQRILPRAQADVRIGVLHDLEYRQGRVHADAPRPDDAFVAHLRKRAMSRASTPSR